MRIAALRKRLFPLLLTSLSAIVLFLPPGAFGAGKTRLIDNFEKGLSPGWQEKSFKGHTVYRVVGGEEGHVLQAVSHGAASGLVYKIDYNPGSFPILAWRWKVKGVLPKGDARTKSGDDFAARLYVVFPSWFFPLTKSLTYIWANKLPQGTLIPNAFTGNDRMIAVESGDQKAGKWIAEHRDIVADYRRAFGGDPPSVGAIAIMTDTDNTGESAEAWYDDIRIEGE